MWQNGRLAEWQNGRMADREGGMFTSFGSYVLCERSVGAKFVDQDSLPALRAEPQEADQVGVGDTRNGAHLRGGVFPI